MFEIQSFILSPSQPVLTTVMYLDITADVLLGTPEIPGILPDLFAAIGAPERLTSLLLCRPLFLALFTALVAAPVSLQRNIASLDGLNVAGLAALCAFGLSLAWLSAAAVLQGHAHLMPLWPEPPAASGGGRVSSFGPQALIVLSVLPALLTADGCHLNVMPLAAMMRPFSKRSMDSVVAVSIVRVMGQILRLALLTSHISRCCGHVFVASLPYFHTLPSLPPHLIPCLQSAATCFYILISAASYTAFGTDIEEDILKNIHPLSMQPLLGTTQVGPHTQFAPALLVNIFLGWQV